MEECPIKYALGLLSGKWTLKILWELSQGRPVRFNELRRNLGDISNVMLSKTLRELEENHLVVRKQYNEVPPRVEYRLSDLGEAIEPSLRGLGDWGAEVYRFNHTVPLSSET